MCLRLQFSEAPQWGSCGVCWATQGPVQWHQVQSCLGLNPAAGVRMWKRDPERGSHCRAPAQQEPSHSCRC